METLEYFRNSCTRDARNFTIKTEIKMINVLLPFCFIYVHLLFLAIVSYSLQLEILRDYEAHALNYIPGVSKCCVLYSSCTNHSIILKMASNFF